MTTTIAKRVTTTSSNEYGHTLSSTEHTTTYSNKVPVVTGGMALTNRKELFSLLPLIVRSEVDATVLSFLLTNQRKTSIIADSKGTPYTINAIATAVGTSSSTVVRILGRASKTNLIQRYNNSYVVNPFIALPYGNSRHDNLLLQLQWKTQYKVPVEKLLLPTDITTTTSTLDLL